MTVAEIFTSENGRLIAESSKDAMAVVVVEDGVRYFVYANPAFESLFGHRRDRLAGSPFDLLLPPRPPAPGPADLQDTALVTATGEEVRAQVTFTPLATAVGAAELVVLRDVTELRRLQQIAAASVVSESTGYLFAGIRHELGNPLNSLKAALTLLADPTLDLPPHRRMDYLSRALGEIRRMEALLLQLRTFNPHESVSTEPVSLRRFVERFYELSLDSCSERGTLLSLEEGTEVEAVVDARLLQQALLLLLSNALDCLAGRPRSRIVLGCQIRGKTARLTLSDNGPGMSPEALLHAQRPFVTSKPKGTGLGLPLAHRYVTLAGGRLELTSTPDVGTTCLLHFDLIDSIDT